MNILILHRIPYYKIDYHRGIDHTLHQVVYIGTKESLQNIPDHLACKKIIRAGKQLEAEVKHYLSHAGIHFDHLISLSEYELLAAALLREQFNIPGPKTHQVELVRNKLKMKDAVKRHGINVPIFVSLEELMKTEYDFLHPDSVVLKPIDGASSENIIVFDHLHQLKQCVRDRKTGIPDLDCGIKKFDCFEVESFISGNILHFDGLVMDGKIKTILASQYVGNCLDYAQGNPLGSVQITTTIALQTWAQQCIDAVQITTGSFHLEAIQNASGLYFLEIANRVGGADVVKTVEMATGIHLPSMELKMLLKNDPIIFPPLPEKWKDKYGWFVFPGHHIPSGFVTKINLSLFKNHEFIVDWHELPADQICKKNITYQSTEVPLAGIVKSDHSMDLITFLQFMFSKIQIVDQTTRVEKVA